VLPQAAPLLAGAGSSPPSGSGGADSLGPANIVATTDPRLATLGAAAEATWSALLGPSTTLNVQFVATSLPPREIGEARVTPSRPGALPWVGAPPLRPGAPGLGWSAARAPQPPTPFSPPLSSTAFQAPPGSPATGHYDLFTTILHEVGHLLGFYADDP